MLGLGNGNLSLCFSFEFLSPFHFGIISWILTLCWFNLFLLQWNFGVKASSFNDCYGFSLRRSWKATLGPWWMLFPHNSDKMPAETSRFFEFGRFASTKEDSKKSNFRLISHEGPGRESIICCTKSLCCMSFSLSNAWYNVSLDWSFVAVAKLFSSFPVWVLSEICLSLPPQDMLIFSWSPSCQQHQSFTTLHQSPVIKLHQSSIR